MKIRKLIFLINCLVAIFVAQMPQDVAAQEAPNALRLWKDGKVVAQTNTIVDSIVLFYYPAPSPPQTPDPTTVGGIVPTVEQAIDMGLSVKWAPWNMGASKAEEYGAYFAWGEVNARMGGFKWGSYYWMAEGKADWMHINKYQIADNETEADWYSFGQFVGDNKSYLENCDDAAIANWGSEWRMPTTAEFEELLDEDNCTWTWIENYEDTDKSGYEVKSKKTDGVLFFPAAGYFETNLGNYGETGYGNYWSSELRSSFQGCTLHFFVEYDLSIGSALRCEGCSVRAVAVSAE